MAQTYVGFYWTLPVNRIGFRHLPKDAEQAAKVSRTIRYQRALVRDYVITLEGQLEGHLLGEIAFMDTRTDRATAAMREALMGIGKIPGGREAALLYVAFEEVRLWRNN